MSQALINLLDYMTTMSQVEGLTDKGPFESVPYTLREEYARDEEVGE